METEKYLHTTHRTVSWFQKTFIADELELAAPFQRNPVWTDRQKAFLIDTILLGLPIPELYMQDAVSESGEEIHTVVDGQQRVRACLDFLAGSFALDDDEIGGTWKGLRFEQLGSAEKQRIFAYRFVVRVLPQMPEKDLRAIFARLNRNVVALNDQELRNATYWGGFISAVQEMADSISFFADAGIFSANDHRRMLDHEYISELVVAYLHGPQNKKDRLDEYYQRYEDSFPERERVISDFQKITGEISQILPDLKSSRWRKKSDFYSLFLAVARHLKAIPFSSNVRDDLRVRLEALARYVDDLVKLEEGQQVSAKEAPIKYARAVSRAASDKLNRIARDEVLQELIEYSIHPSSFPN